MKSKLKEILREELKNELIEELKEQIKDEVRLEVQEFMTQLAYELHEIVTANSASSVEFSV